MSPVEVTTDDGGNPWRVSDSTQVTEANPSSSPVRHAGRWRVAHKTSRAICEISPISCTADAPAPTTMTRFLSKSAALL